MKAFPQREGSGALARPSARQLSPWEEAFTIDYRKGALETPASVAFSANAPGVFNTVIWAQELYYRDLRIFENESIAWIENPTRVEPGSRLRVALDSRWRQSNVLRVATPRG
jgi:hypothetical protein